MRTSKSIYLLFACISLRWISIYLIIRLHLRFTARQQFVDTTIEVCMQVLRYISTNWFSGTINKGSFESGFEQHSFLVQQSTLYIIIVVDLTRSEGITRIERHKYESDVWKPHYTMLMEYFYDKKITSKYKWCSEHWLIIIEHTREKFGC